LEKPFFQCKSILRRSNHAQRSRVVLKILLQTILVRVRGVRDAAGLVENVGIVVPPLTFVVIARVIIRRSGHGKLGLRKTWHQKTPRSPLTRQLPSGDRTGSKVVIPMLFLFPAFKYSNRSQPDLGPRRSLHSVRNARGNAPFRKLTG
jgi:hypothetical protein